MSHKAPKEKEASSAENKHQPLERLHHITTDFGTFSPGQLEGFYINPSTGKEQGSEQEEVVDFQIILSKEEYLVLQARQHKHINRRSSNNDDTPYIDSWRVDQTLFRSNSRLPGEKQNWLTPRGFRK